MKHAKYTKELTNVFAQIGDRELLDEFLKDLLTPSEYRDIVTRLQIVKMLDEGISQRDIAKRLGVSISKVTRGSRELLDKKGGFRKILDKFYKK
ncbi:winged helix-turn-helix transcriptional regulator [Candidatus Parcubacteria bacterium]|jgi:TrpR family transcriptional regulator, trp operon repressor|nr:winged helix-turn-helix transcriptional regulator [Candidatus Parcubacteria bacterium]MBT3948921.1 winged helix-turn-helix transcriptional regulator [Candidatus Parcubacteria bacterium]